MPLVTLISYVVVVLSGTVGAFVLIRGGSSFGFKIFASLQVCTAFVELGLLFFDSYLPKGNNLPVYNCFMLVYFMTYAYYFRQIIQSTFVQTMIKGFLYIYPIFWCFVVFYVFKFNEWNSYVFIAGGMFTLFWATIYCYQILSADQPIMLRYCPEFWIAIGLIFFYVCGVPYMGMFNFLTKYHNDLAQLLKIPWQIVNIVMYSMFTYAFICQLTNTKKS